MFPLSVSSYCSIRESRLWLWLVSISSFCNWGTIAVQINMQAKCNASGLSRHMAVFGTVISQQGGSGFEHTGRWGSIFSAYHGFSVSLKVSWNYLQLLSLDKQYSCWMYVVTRLQFSKMANWIYIQMWILILCTRPIPPWCTCHTVLYIIKYSYS